MLSYSPHFFLLSTQGQIFNTEPPTSCAEGGSFTPGSRYDGYDE